MALHGEKVQKRRHSHGIEETSLGTPSGKSLLNELGAYLQTCHPEEPRKKGERIPFPNLAGFCRYLRIGLSQMERLRTEDPAAYSEICAVLEDEALNSDLSPTLLTAYLKKRLGYGEKQESSTEAECGQLRLVFDHDILEDGE